MADKTPVAILGATGMVGQRFIQLLEHHPLFEVGALLASERSAGKPYAVAANWVLATPMPQAVREMIVLEIDAKPPCQWVFSALPGSLAGDVERRLAAAGHVVCSNASAHRMDSLVPLLIPEVNPDHLDFIPRQRKLKRWEGLLVTAPNCTTTVLAMALKPLHDAFTIKAIHAVSLQALSGAGYPGVSSMDVIDNVLPHIPGEEPKFITEPLKLLGRVTDQGIVNAGFRMSGQCNRVAVIDGHMVCANVEFEQPPSINEFIAALDEFESPAEVAGLPSAPVKPIYVTRDPARPQPRLDRDAGDGMSITVGRVQSSATAHIQFVVLGHNTLRGAAGGALLNGELLLTRLGEWGLA